MTRNRSLAVLAGSVLSLTAGRSAHAQISWINTLGGSWHLTSNWNPANEPDNAGEDAEISVPGVYAVSLTSTRTIRNLYLFNSDATLNIASGATLAIAGTDCTTDGTLVINSNNGGAATTLALAAGSTLSGFGNVVLNATSGVLDRAYIYNPAQLSWTNDFDHVIRGRGRIYYSFTNNGTLRADAPGELLETTQSTVLNNGFVEAVNGGVFHLNGNSIDQTGGGQMNATGADSVIRMTNARVTSGSMTASGGGRIVSSSGSQAWFGPLNVTGPVDIQNNSIIALTGTLTHSGVITVNNNSGGSATAFTLAAGSTIDGSGSLTLNATSGVLDRAQLYCPTAAGWTNAAGHTINGRGRIYYNLVNNGLISANVPAEYVEMLQGVVTNTATLESNGGHLQLTTETVNQSGGTIAATNGGNVYLNSATISGGTLTSSGASKVISIAGTQTLTGNVTVGGVLDVTNNSSVAFSSSCTHNGTATINPGGGGSATTITVAGGATLGGTGTIILNATSGILDRAQLFSINQAAWTHGPAHTIRGRGRVYYNLINNGSIIADMTSEILEFTQGAVTNNGTLQTASGGIMQFNGETVNQSTNGVITAANGDIRMIGSTISGGTVNTVGANKLVSTSGSQTFSGGVVLNANTDINNGSILTCPQGLTQNGTIVINAEGGGAATVMTVAAGTTVDGTGAIVLNATSGVLDRAQLFSASQAAWTHAAGHTIRGRGHIYYNLVNNGTITADMPNEILELTQGTVSNNATMRTLSGGILQFFGETINQSTTGVISATNGDVRLAGATISGGSISSTGASKVVATSGSQTLSGGISLAGVFDVQNGTNISCPSGLTNSGTLTINSNSGGAATFCLIGSGGTLQGSGRLVLNATSDIFDRAYINAPSGSFTNGSGHTIAGTGNIYATWTNSGIVRPSGPSRELACQSGRFTQSSTGSLVIELAGTAGGQFSRLTGPQPKTLGGTLVVTTVSGYVPPCGSTYTIITGPITGTFENIALPQVPVGQMNVLYTANSVILSYVPSDYNGDGFVDAFDYDDYVACFEGIACLPGKSSDFNNDGFTDAFDYDDFVLYFESGC